MTEALLANLLSHLDQEWAVVAITPDEVAVLRNEGYVSNHGLTLTTQGRAKLAALRESHDGR